MFFRLKKTLGQPVLNKIQDDVFEQVKTQFVEPEIEPVICSFGEKFFTTLLCFFCFFVIVACFILLIFVLIDEKI